LYRDTAWLVKSGARRSYFTTSNALTPAVLAFFDALVGLLTGGGRRQ